MSGPKQTTSVDIPDYIEDASKQNIAMAGRIGQIGYTPYYGPDVAAFTPQQNAAFQGANDAAAAFGMPTGGLGLPAPQNFGGVSGYSSGGMFDQAIQALKDRRPGQYAGMAAPFINPWVNPAPNASPWAATAPGTSGTPGYQPSPAQGTPNGAQLPRWHPAHPDQANGYVNYADWAGR